MARRRSDVTRRLPKQGPKFARAALLHAVSLASTAMTLAMGRLHEKAQCSGVHEDELAALKGESALL